MKFTQQEHGQYHVGDLEVNGVTHQTPTYIIHTRRATIPHLTNDNLKLVIESSESNSAIINLNLWEMIESFPPTIAEKRPLPELFNFKRSDNYSLILSIRDSQYSQHTHLANDKFLSGDASSGRKKLSVPEFIRSIQAYNPDMHVMMHDSGIGTGSGEPVNSFNFSESQIAKKRIIKALDRTTNWYKQQAAVDVPSARLSGVVLHSTTANKCVDLSETNAFCIGDFGAVAPSERQNMMSDLVKYIKSSKGANSLTLICGQDHPFEILECVETGVDLFDGTYPFTCAEGGYASTYPLDIGDTISAEDDKMKINLRDVKYARDFTPISAKCPCWCCKNHTRAYIHHLLNAHEMLAEVLLTMHNLHHYLSFFGSIRRNIKNGTFAELKKFILNECQSN